MVNYKNYTVWQKSHHLVLKIYKTTGAFQKSEQFNFVSQINRTALSIPTNIAEGCGRETQKELIRFLYIASGSAHELDYLILASTELGFVKKVDSENLIKNVDEIKKMLFSLIKTIKKTL
ncbi:MAG: four helix bundle protein [Winogradskyella sp.]|uniref:four helix bundle protein n=1 Tax=Winogradskyella sp. TaxID=1883156 RepID=UPI001833BE5A|nr:four helix bundle protein [Winogradskyella sp.]MBT8244437.1 four helix bundle protein [Winogradskyella sp.]NNK22539.1 four helix bundle protein [Winogradskyella sp.]